MKYVTASLSLGPSYRHPMHDFVVDHDGFEASRLLGSTVSGRHHTAIFHVDGWPPGPYDAALDDLESIHEYALSPQSDETIAVYVQEELTESDRALITGLGQPGIVALYPISYQADGSMRLTIVGPSDTLQNALDAIPDEVAVEARAIGDYEARRVGGVPDLTDRQAEAITAAVDCGYYEDPREASVAEIGEALGCGPSTAAEHLRRAERTVMRSYVME